MQESGGGFDFNLQPCYIPGIIHQKQHTVYLLEMTHKTKIKESSAVDKSLVAMFLRMTVEERVQANDNAVRAILELRDAYQKRKNVESGSGSAD